MQNPRQAQTRLKPLLTHSRRVNQTLGAGRRWAEVGCRDSARGLKQNESACVLSTPDSTILRLPASSAEVGEDGLPPLACVQVWGPAPASKMVPEAGQRVPHHCNGNDTDIARRTAGHAMAIHSRGVSG
ncbi:hypothetical protein EMIHUDRAFT_229096 [Emiliania huxleyi CCMP1516]|jgi:hypothetical protein|uniref:Uncharacterized protein n=2 Tax=Emiliania huxleyi TaxID=2903 RepID=A0A0D3KDI3_EMIH1|nr:hypothetical protein EMIHUDRAFT_229096 [Emiliania huxleyi CCMP1516]EOD33818.1 hypothetical protein EMIHUDRAFT_229096 [Emiliania huxleyi CCMP1516]|eukprot:XP_005786247.1 hypothetical protein EMIHUDRAFT_229096 [Emiliania huxleyi CCMP1516]